MTTILHLIISVCEKSVVDFSPLLSILSAFLTMYYCLLQKINNFVQYKEKHYLLYHKLNNCDFLRFINETQLRIYLSRIQQLSCMKFWLIFT